MSSSSDDAAPGALAALRAVLAPLIAPIVREAVERALAEHADGAQSADALIDSSECARRMGVSLPTLRKMAIPHILCGEHRRYRWPDVLEHLKRQRAGSGNAE